MHLEDIGTVAKAQRHLGILELGRCQAGDRDRHVCPQHQDPPLRIEELVHVLFIDVVKACFIRLVKLDRRRDDLFIAPARKPLFDRLLQLSAGCAFFSYAVPHACGYRKLLHRSFLLAPRNKKAFIQRTKASWCHLFSSFPHGNDLCEYLHTAHDNGCLPVKATACCSFPLTTPRCVHSAPASSFTSRGLSVPFAAVTLPLLRFICFYHTIFENTCQQVL